MTELGQSAPRAARAAREWSRAARRCGPWCAAAALATLAGCGGGGATTAPTAIPLRFIATNALVAPVTISVDGVALVTLTSGRSTGMTVASTARSITWSSAKTTDANGVPIPDDLDEVRVPVSSVGTTLEIANVIGGDTYVTARLFNSTTARVSIGVWDGTAVSCAGILPGAADGATGFVVIGYYRLRAATEVRAFRDSSSCTGPYLAWPRSQLDGFAPKSGLVNLALDQAP